MSIFDDEDTLCQRENNGCKRRNKCLRYLKAQGDLDWVADYFHEHGQFCPHFIPHKEKLNADTLGVPKGTGNGSTKD